MDQEKLNKLYEDFVIEVKPGKGAFKYVRTRNILDRMNRTFDGNWGTHIVSHSEVGDEILVLAAVYLYDEKGNVLAQQEGFGSAKKFTGVELGNTYKSATSKAIKSAVRNWGVALFLEEGEAVDYTAPLNKNTSTPVNMGIPTNMPSFGSTPTSVNIPTDVPSMPSMPSTPSTPSMPNTGMPINTPSTAMPSMPTMPSMPSAPAMPNVVEEVQQAPVQNTGSFPTMGGSSVEQTGTTDNTQASITHVQKVAIMSRLASKGKTFEEICTDFYADRPAGSFVDSIDKMTYQDALALVAFLNSK